MTRTLLFIQKSFRARPVPRFTRLTVCYFHSSLRCQHRPSEAGFRYSVGDAPNFPPLTASTKQLSINAKAESTSYQDILEALEDFNNFSRTQHDELKIEKNALIILATPGFAPWLEDRAGFVEEVLSQITKKSVWNSSCRREIDVICACVDGLSPKPLAIPFYRGKVPIEGFSFLYGSREHVLPKWKDDDAASAKDSSLQSSITFSKSATSGSYDITVPLATTLFRNGRHSTLLVSKWLQTSADTFVKTKGPFEKKNVQVQICRNDLDKFPESYIPAIALTPARRIVNGLGNIVRRLDFGDGDIGPASQELEARVTAELKGRPGTKLDIWAMIIPSHLIAKWENDSNALAVNQKQVLERQQTSGTPDYPYMDHWLAQGAILCRVLSGGGGWGLKQGLLSLDPQTTHDEINEARFDFSEGSLEDQQASALGRLAREGDFIQFFTAKTKKIPYHPGGYNPKNEDLETNTSTSTVLGTTPSTRDEIPSTLGSESTRAKAAERNLFVWRGHFGCVSESGIFVHRNDTEIGTWVTKLDSPYSYLFYNYDIIPRAIRLFDSKRTLRIQRSLSTK